MGFSRKPRQARVGIEEDVLPDLTVSSSNTHFLINENKSSESLSKRDKICATQVADDTVGSGCCRLSGGEARRVAQCTRSTRSHISRNLFSLGNGLIVILLLLLCWTCLVHGGFPGRGPPPPRGPPLFPHHPHPPRSSLFSRRRPPPPPRMSPAGRHHPPHPPRPSKMKPEARSDLAVAAQTLYDLRGYQFPFTGPENQRFHRQNDPFTLPTPVAPNPRASGSHHVPQQDSRTAPLVFPSFYQEQPTPAPARSTIFGHNQHLSQTRFEPPGTFHLGGNSASTKITLEQQSASTRDQFRPSQIDISLHNNQVQSTPSPLYGQQQVPSSVAPEKKSLIPSSTSRSRAPVKLHKNQHDPFVYVYDEVDYEDGDDEFTLGRHRTPQGQINNNRITPSTSTTTVAPLRSREPQLLSSPPPFQQPLYQHHNPVHQPLYSTSTTTKQPSTTANSLFFQPAKDDYRDAFRDHGIIRPPVTPRPNVEIVPSSERKPPPDQSNAIQPALVRIQNNQNFGRQPTAPQAQVPHVADHFENRSRRPSLTTSTTTAAPQQFPTGNSHNFQRDSIVPTYHPPQGRQATPTPQTTPLPYFPSGLDRRPFETNNEIPSAVGHNRNNHFDQVVNVLQEEEEDFPQSDVVSQLEGFNNPSKLRPVNTIVPKNRIPKEDIILPPNFQFTHAQQEVTTTLAPIIPEVTSTRIRGDPVQLRVREQTRIREELPRQHQRVVSTQAPVRNRPSVIFPDDDDDDDDIDQNNIRLINQQQAPTFPPPSPTPTRTRGRNPTARPHTTTTTLAPAEVPQRTRTQSPRQRLRPTQRHTTTTTTTTTTTPVPTYIEYPSQEYVDDYDNTPYQQSPAPPPQVQAPAVSEQPKSFSRFPPFPNKNKEVVTRQTTPAPTRHQRPVPVQQHGRPRPGKSNNNRFRETSTQDTTSPRTTGKPLYTTGRMLSREGGLYAGQQITSSHVYGQPVPNIPINSVLDRVPGVLDGRTATTKPNFSSPQKHLRSKQRYQEHGPPSRVTTSSQRLRASPTPRPVQENSLDIVETVTLRPYQEDRSKSLEEPKRLRPGSQFLRGQHQQQQSAEGGEQVLPRRRKARPGQKRLHTTSAEPFTENVALHSQKDDDDVSQFQTERAQIIREHLPETTTPGSGPTPRSRRPRPGRPNKPSQSASENVANVSERSRESSDTTSEEPQQHQQPKLVKAVRKLRPRLRPVPVGQLNPQQQRGQPSEIVAQAQSAQIERKPTDAPGRFSSRFREDNYESTTVSTLRGEEEERPSSTGSSRFSPSVPRATFKPPAKKAGSQQGRKRPQQQQQQNESDEELPASIKLSPKDVIENRKPARRIPPGSASDRLKALQQRRNKIFNGNGNRQDHGEQTAEGRQVPVTKRPRLKFSPAVQQQQQQQEELPEDVEERPASPPQSHRLRKPLQQKQQQQQQHTSTEANGQKREIVGRGQDKQVRTRNELDYYNNVPTVTDDFDEDEDSDYSDDAPIPPRHHQLANRPPKNNGFHRNRSVEVSSDEARSILGISRPAMPNRAPNGKKFRPQPQEEEEPTEEEFEEEPAQVQQSQHQQFQQQQRPPRLHHQNQNVRQRSRENTQEEEEQQQEQPQPPPRRQFSNQGGHQKIRPNQKPLKSKPPPPPLEEEEEEEEEEDQTPQYQEEPEDDRPEPPRKPFLKHHFKQNHYVSTSSIAPSTTSRKLHKNFNNQNARKAQQQQQQKFREEEEEEEDREEVDRVTPSSRPRTSTFTSSSTSSTTSSSTSQTASPSPVALPQRQGPQPIKQGLLKARLRPNRRLSSGGGAGGNQQPRVSVTATTTEATITEERSEERKQPGLKHGTILVSKSPRPRLGGGGKRNSKKFISMATENPSLPLESIFPEVAR